MFLPGNLHDVVVELEGIGGGGKLQLEVSFSAIKILVGHRVPERRTLQYLYYLQHDP